MCSNDLDCGMDLSKCCTQLTISVPAAVKLVLSTLDSLFGTPFEDWLTYESSKFCMSKKTSDSIDKLIGVPAREAKITFSLDCGTDIRVIIIAVVAGGVFILLIITICCICKCVKRKNALARIKKNETIEMQSFKDHTTIV